MRIIWGKYSQFDAFWEIGNRICSDSGFQSLVCINQAHPLHSCQKSVTALDQLASKFKGAR